MSTSMIYDQPDPNKERAPSAELAVLNPVDRVSEMLFGLLMALTFIGAVSAAESDCASLGRTDPSESGPGWWCRS